MIFYYGLTDIDRNFTLLNLAQITTPENLKALGLSLLLSLISTVICLILAYPLAMILSAQNRNQTSFIVLIFILPMWMNFLLRTLAWQTLLEKNGVINVILSFLHLPEINIINTPYAIVLGMVYNFLPFMVLPIYNVLIKIDRDVINAARDLGANTLQVFTKITMPLSVPGIISGITMVFVPALTTFVISDILGGSKILLIGNVIEQEFPEHFMQKPLTNELDIELEQQDTFLFNACVHSESAHSEGSPYRALRRTSLISSYISSTTSAEE